MKTKPFSVALIIFVIASSVAHANDCYLGLWAGDFEFRGSRAIPYARSWQECYQAAIRRAGQFDDTQRLCSRYQPDQCADYWTYVFWSYKVEDYGSNWLDVSQYSGKVTKWSDSNGPMTGDRRIYPR